MPRLPLRMQPKQGPLLQIKRSITPIGRTAPADFASTETSRYSLAGILDEVGYYCVDGMAIMVALKPDLPCSFIIGMNVTTATAAAEQRGVVDHSGKPVSY